MMDKARRKKRADEQADKFKWWGAYLNDHTESRRIAMQKEDTAYMQTSIIQLSNRCLLVNIKLQMVVRYLATVATTSRNTVGRIHPACGLSLRKGICMNLYYYDRHLQKIQYWNMIETKKRVPKERYDEAKQSLSLSNTRDCWRDLICCVHAPKIKALTLSGNQIRDSHINFLITLDFSNLTLLWLNDNNITKDGIMALSKKNWPHLQDLSICDNQLRKQGVVLLLNSAFDALKTLNIGLNQLQPERVSVSLNPLRTSYISNLNICNNKMGADGIKLLTKVKFNGLVRLNISQCEIGDEGAKHLSKGSWRVLEELEAGYNNISMDGLRSLAENDWEALSKLIIFYNVMSFIGITQLFRLKTRKLIESDICWWGLKNDQLEKQTKLLIAKQRPNPQKNRNRYGYDQD